MDEDWTSSCELVPTTFISGGLLYGGVPDKVGYTISKGRSAVRTIDRSNRAQAPKIIKEFVAPVVLAMKYPKLILRFGHEENLAHNIVPLSD
jgi:hypothetical protein